MPAIEPIGPHAVHLAVDMQRLFAEATPWHTPTLWDILPNVLRLAEARPSETLYSRFVVPANAAAAPGRWKTYYERWPMLTGEAMDASLLDLVAPLAAIAPPGSVFDKTTYSLFETPAFVECLSRDGVDTIVMTGLETDACVLATTLSAVDRGFRVIAVEDALTSSDRAAHRATIDLLLPRMRDQVDVVDTATVLEAWR